MVQLLIYTQTDIMIIFCATITYFVLSVLTLADIQARSKLVFSDVQDDFCNVKKILSRFEEWRGSYSESYHNAYISLCLPKLLNPIIRHQLLAWNPLKVCVNRNLVQHVQLLQSLHHE